MRDRLISILATAVMVAFVLSVVVGIVIAFAGGVTNQDSVKVVGFAFIFGPVALGILGLIVAQLTGSNEFEEKYGKYSW